MPSTPIVGTVTRTSNGSKPYTATYADGRSAGDFTSVRDAQIPIEAQQGRQLRWTRVDLPGGIESYRAQPLS